MSALALYFHTLRHLRPIQVRHQLLMRLRPARGGGANARACATVASSIAPRPRPGIEPVKVLPAATQALSAQFEFRFLNASLPMRAGSIDWAASHMPRLWRYNLHYFDWLHATQVSQADKAALLSDWVRRNPPGTADAWEPYPASLRIVNWIKYLLAVPAAATEEVRQSLFAQVSWLEGKLEFHLLGNHLLKNAVALLFGGAYFDGPVADRWFRAGCRLVRQQTTEQFLHDGGHFERSPMYHCIALLDCLDSLALVRQMRDAAPRPFKDQEDEQHLVRVALGAAEFLRDICLPDGDIPLFNDSATGTAPSPEALLRYAAELLGAPALCAPTSAGAVFKAASGYFGFRDGGDMLVIDCGAVGPDYQPGHAHCDTLSYELALGGRRVIVDSGVYEYAAGTRRQRCRETASHNTVVLDEAEQSEIWGEFRVARRARPLGARAGTTAEGIWKFEGAHDGYRRLPGKPVHHRRVSYARSGCIEVLDQITGRGEHSAVSRIRLHPDYRIVINSCYAQIVSRDGRAVARIEPIGTERMEIESGEYFPEFGQAFAIDVLTLSVAGVLPLRFGYRIVKGS